MSLTERPSPKHKPVSLFVTCMGQTAGASRVSILVKLL
jgi:hypothetical protein